MNTLGAAFRNARKRHGMTLKQVSKKTGLSISFLSEIERGITLPSIRSATKIAECYGYEFRIKLAAKEESE